MPTYPYKVWRCFLLYIIRIIIMNNEVIINICIQEKVLNILSSGWGWSFVSSATQSCKQSKKEYCIFYLFISKVTFG